ncbi:hypothetical protein ACJMK2_011558 [Sinanodonta woodiana]|uniref:G-protein coupled receptors family 2 profile 2 domain-containing protein n=1 Tax=Sinanodonta woodiana TaxID=1069815 RepID=A0ABD3V5D9_SINWO
MSSPGCLAVCCLSNKNENVTSHETLLIEKETVTIISLVFSLFGCLGVCLIWCLKDNACREHSLTRRNRPSVFSGPILNHIITCLLMADALGNVGIVVRSCVWLSGVIPNPGSENKDTLSHALCIAFGVFVQYFLLASTFWHLVYGIEVYLVASGKKSGKWLQHFLGWLMPAIFCSLGAWVVYQPNLESCGAQRPKDKAMLYFVMLSPVILVIVFNIVLFYKAVKSVRRALIHQFGRFSNTERQIVDSVKWKFILIVGSFTACWLPNILNGILANVLDYHSSYCMLIFLVLISVMNPMQALLDAMILWGWSSSCSLFSRSSNSEYLEITHGEANLHSSLTRSKSVGSEYDPLISFSRSRR